MTGLLMVFAEGKSIIWVKPVNYCSLEFQYSLIASLRLKKTHLLVISPGKLKVVIRGKLLTEDESRLWITKPEIFNSSGDFDKPPQ